VIVIKIVYLATFGPYSFLTVSVKWKNAKATNSPSVNLAFKKKHNQLFLQKPSRRFVFSILTAVYKPISWHTNKSSVKK
jgi:hypothetical protein